MRRLKFGVAVAMGSVLAAMASCAFRDVGCRQQSAPALSGVGERADQPARIKLEDGVEVEPVRVRWLEGAWQPIASIVRGPEETVNIARLDSGEYLMTADPPNPGEETRLVVFMVDCHRLVHVRMKSAAGESPPMYAVLNGYGERLSLDIIPALFPQVWSDKRLLARVGSSEPEVPVERRLAVLASMVGLIDEIGTFMEQDMTYYRPGLGK